MGNLLDKLRWRLHFAFSGSLMPLLGLRHQLPSGIDIEVASLADWNIYNDIFVDGEYDRAIN